MARPPCVEAPVRPDASGPIKPRSPLIAQRSCRDRVSAAGCETGVMTSAAVPPQSPVRGVLERLAAGDRGERLTHVEVLPPRRATYADVAGLGAPGGARGARRPGSSTVSGRTRRPGRRWPTPAATWSSRPAPRPASRWPTSCPPCRRASRSAGRAASAGRPPSTSPRPRRSPRTSSPRCSALGLGVRATTHDGDSSHEQRDWSRDHGEYLLTNPDMLHRSLLPGHARWARFFGSLRYVVIDECHHYRGRVRRPRLPRAAPAAPGVRAVRRRPDVRARLGDRRRARRAGRPADRARGDRGDRRRLAAGRGRPRAVGAAVHRAPRRERRPGAARRQLGGRRPAHRPGRRGRPHAGVHPVAAGRRGGGRHRVRAARRGGARARGPGGAVPRWLPARGAPRAGAGAAVRAAGRAGRDQRARAGHRRQRPRRGADGRLPRDPRRSCGSRSAGPVAAGRTRSA